jgi:hypothetical protein
VRNEGKKEKAACDFFVHFVFFCWDYDSRLADSRRESQAGNSHFAWRIEKMSRVFFSQLNASFAS